MNGGPKKGTQYGFSRQVNLDSGPLGVSKQLIHVSMPNSSGLKILVTIVYGHGTTRERNLFCLELNEIFVTMGPQKWVVLNDFNEALLSTERQVLTQ